MATKLLKDVKRETFCTDQKGRALIVTLGSDSMLEFRAKGKRTVYRVPIQAAYNMALIATMGEIYKEKMQIFKEKKAAGKRCRKPKPLPRIFSAKIYEALKLK